MSVDGVEIVPRASVLGFSAIALRVASHGAHHVRVDHRLRRLVLVLECVLGRHLLLQRERTHLKLLLLPVVLPERLGVGVMEIRLAFRVDGLSIARRLDTLRSPHLLRSNHGCLLAAGEPARRMRRPLVPCHATIHAILLLNRNRVERIL